MRALGRKHCVVPSSHLRFPAYKCNRFKEAIRGWYPLNINQPKWVFWTPGFVRVSPLPTVKWTGWETVSALSWEILPLISSTPIAAVSFLSIFLLPTLSQGKGKGSILYSDRRSGQIPIENTSAWQLLDYLTLISLPPSIHSNHWLHFSIYFTINASGPTEQSSDESTAQSISLAPQVLVKSCMSLQEQTRI